MATCPRFRRPYSDYLVQNAYRCLVRENDDGHKARKGLGDAIDRLIDALGELKDAHTAGARVGAAIGSLDEAVADVCAAYDEVAR